MKSLYVTDRRAMGDDAFRTLLKRLAGAPDLSVQLREKDLPDSETLAWTGTCRGCLGASVALYVNRRLDVALAGGADGVHLPADGLPLGRVRANTPRGFRIGVSTHSAEEAARAIDDGADLVVIGPIFDSPAKREFGAPLGPDELAGLPERSRHRTDVLAIGGISEGSLDALEPYRDRIDGIAGIRLFQESADPGGLVARVARRWSHQGR